MSKQDHFQYKAGAIFLGIIVITLYSSFEDESMAVELCLLICPCQACELLVCVWEREMHVYKRVCVHVYACVCVGVSAYKRVFMHVCVCV